MSGATKGLQLRSLIKKSGELELSLAEVPFPEPDPDQVLVKVEATPINPSDLGLLLGPADMSNAKASGVGERCRHQDHGQSAGAGAADHRRASTRQCRSAMRARAR